jgi:hypothetical protein
VDDLAPDIDGRAKGFQSNFDDVDCANDTRAKAARFEQEDPLLIGRIFALDAVGD